MAAEAPVEAFTAENREALERHSLWHMAFFTSLVARSSVTPAVLEALAEDNITVAVAYSASLLEACAYAKAGRELQHLLSAPLVSCDTVHGTDGAQQPRCWLDVFTARVRHHAKQLLSPNPGASSSILADVLWETQQEYGAEDRAPAHNSSAVFTPCDTLFAALAADCLEHSSSGGQGALQHRRHPLLFQVTPQAQLPSSLAKENAQQQQVQWWCEARLYGALACAASSTAPGPLARLLVAYAHASHGRLQAAVDDNLRTHLNVPVEAEKQCHTPSLSSTEAATAQQARVRLSGIVAGVLEYALYVSTIRSSVTAAALNSSVRPEAAAVRVTAPWVQPHVSPDLTSFARVSQSAALLLVQLTEECGYYYETTPDAEPGAKDVAAESSTAAAASAAASIVHAMQELLFTLVLGGGTQTMPNRPEPVVPQTTTTISPAATTATSLLVVTTRGLTLPEADAITQELFPCLVQQLGVEWPWSPLLRHLSSLDKQPQPPSSPLPHAPVRWSSHMVMDMVLLCVAQKTYPQRLLNILPGSYERLLQRLDLLPPMQSQDNDQGVEEPAASASAAAGRAAQANLFDMPAYYKEPATALVLYFQRAGTSGLRLEEVGRLLETATSSFAMVVRLKAQAPPFSAAGEVEPEEEAEELLNGALGRTERTGKELRASKGVGQPPHTYALSNDRARHLISRFKGEVLLAAVVVYTQLRIPSQVQQLMRALAPLFLKIHLDWRIHHDGSVASWLLQQPQHGGRGLRFSNEAVVLLDQVGYEFYPLEWLPALASSICATTATATTSSALSGFSSAPLPYSLFAAVGHQFRLQLRGTPLGGSGDATLRHPAGPRSSAVMSAADTSPLFPSRGGESDGAEASAAAWRRAERFFTGLMQVCYLDSKTSSTELEGTLAVSSTRRVLTTKDGPAQGGYCSVSIGAAALVASADIASQRLRTLLQQRAVMNAMWGSMDAQSDSSEAGSGHRGRQPQHHRGQKRLRSASCSPEAERVEAAEQLRTMHQLLLDYGASSFDTTVEAADFALTVAQSFLPSTAGMSAAASAHRGKSSDALLQRALEWSRAAVGSPASRARINMLLQQQLQSEAPTSSAASPVSLENVYNSASMDVAWLARRTLRHVPGRIWEKISVQQTQARALAQRELKWMSRLPGSPAPTEAARSSEETEKGATQHRIDPLLLEQWTQCVRVWQQLGLADGLDGGDSVEALLPASAQPTSADEMSCAQWLWYSPFFSAEWASLKTGL